MLVKVEPRAVGLQMLGSWLHLSARSEGDLLVVDLCELRVRSVMLQLERI